MKTNFSQKKRLLEGLITNSFQTTKPNFDPLKSAFKHLKTQRTFYYEHHFQR